MANEYSWQQPVGGKTVVWRPLKVGDQMDLDANYGRADTAYLKKYAQYAARVVRFADKPEKFQVNDFREWDEYDLEALAEEVAHRELARAHALSSERPGSPLANLERAIEGAQMAAAKLGEELRSVLAAARATEQQIGPLSQGGSSASSSK